MTKKLSFDTIQVHGGHTPDSSSKSRAVPIYQLSDRIPLPQGMWRAKPNE